MHLALLKDRFLKKKSKNLSLFKKKKKNYMLK